jgi:hypothetical protein
LGDEGKAAGYSPSRRLCCLSFNLFVLAVTSGNIDPRSDLRASDSKGRWSIVPYAAKRATLRALLSRLRVLNMRDAILGITLRTKFKIWRSKLRQNTR